MSVHPYKSQPKKAFWRKSIEGVYPLDIDEWYTKKFDIGRKPIASAGSCFAQHIGRALRENGYNYVDVEPAPDFLPKEKWLDYGYGMYSARYGNIYTSRQLLQLVKRAVGDFKPVETFWNKSEGYVDPFRPTIEKEPFSSVDELVALRDSHLKYVVELFEKTKVFVFTLGLTETWASKEDGAVFPVCPGTAGGEYSDQKYQFVNLTYPEVRADMMEFISIVRGINPNIKFIFTVSPVPLMATATNYHVAVATMHAKSILRAVAGDLTNKFRFVDYFPSYEIISSHIMGGRFYNPDLRNVAMDGVSHVMKQFFKQHPPLLKSSVTPLNSEDKDEDDIVCDEELVAAFGEDL